MIVCSIARVSENKC